MAAQQHRTVAHMKWWGWGVDGVSFEHRDKPALAPFCLKHVDIDLDAPPEGQPRFEDLDIGAPRLPERLSKELRAAVGVDQVHTDALDRVVHCAGKSLRDLVRIRQGDLPRLPDAVVYPADEAQVQAVLDAVVAADAVLIPFGGGSNIAGSLSPETDEARPVISLDLGRLDRVLSIDADAGLARIQAGALGPAIEEQLTAQGYTLGHFPDSFTHSSLGGWIATRSSGMQSDKYGDIADITRAVRVVQPCGVLVTRPVPSTSTGPSVREMVLGSEGRLGVITEATVQVHKTPDVRVFLGYLFPSWAQGLAAMQEIAESDAAPSVTRVSDARETAFSFATSKERHGVQALVSRGLQEVLRRRDWDLEAMCLSFVGYEGGRAHVVRQRAIVRSIVHRHGGMGIGKGPGTLYDQKKFDTPYIRDYLLDRGAMADVSETSAAWSELLPLYRHVVREANKAFDAIGVRGWIMCHLSHSYHSGACLYFTFAFKHKDEPLKEYDVVKRAIQQGFVDRVATLSHHHGVGTEHAPWLAEDISPAGAQLVGKLFAAVDPGRHLNPGKVVR